MHTSTFRSRLASVFRSTVRPVFSSAATPVLAALLLAGALTACARTPTTVSIAVTSHADGARVTGSRTITVSGTLDGGPVTGFEVTLNGSTVGAASHTGTSFEAPVTLADGANTVTITATSGAGSASKTLTLTYPFLTFQDFAPATTVIGQPDFVSTATTATASGLNNVEGSPALDGGALYVPDTYQNRVLGYTAGVPTADGAAADVVLGQPDATSVAAGTAADALNTPRSLAAGGGALFAADPGNNRVLGWRSAPTSTHAPADLVLGQAAFSTNAAACSATGMTAPDAVRVAGSLLLVADSDNNRVLIYHGVPTASGATPDVVLGQSDLTHCTANDDDQNGTADAGPSARTLWYPTDVWTDGTRLAVADLVNNRVLIWNTIPTADFAPADVVLGQPDMTSAAVAAGADGMDQPFRLAGNGNQLFVADSRQHRILIFDAVPTTNGASADRVLGQSTFTNVTRNDDNQDGVHDATPSARTLYYPSGLLVTDNALLVSDGGNSRVLVFRP